MKQAICILTVFVTVGLTAQQPSSPPSTPPGVFAAPAAAPPIVGFTNGVGGFGFTNQFGTNIIGTQFASALSVMQNDIQQTLGLIAAFNANPGSISAAELQVPRGRAAPAPGDLSKDLAGSAAVNVGQDLGANVATPTGNFSFTAPPPPSASEAGNSATTAPALATPPAGVTAALGVASPVGSVSTNAPADPAASANSVALLILQNDLQRVLAEIAALNGESVFVAAPLTNEPAAQGTTPATRLTPTGR